MFQAHFYHSTIYKTGKARSWQSFLLQPWTISFILPPEKALITGWALLSIGHSRSSTWKTIKNFGWCSQAAKTQCCWSLQGFLRVQWGWWPCPRIRLFMSADSAIRFCEYPLERPVHIFWALVCSKEIIRAMHSGLENFMKVTFMAMCVCFRKYFMLLQYFCNIIIILLLLLKYNTILLLRIMLLHFKVLFSLLLWKQQNKRENVHSVEILLSCSVPGHILLL